MILQNGVGCQLRDCGFQPQRSIGLRLEAPATLKISML